MHNQSDVHFQKKINNLAKEIICENENKTMRKQKKYTYHAPTLADAGEILSSRVNSREHSLTGACKPSTRIYRPSSNVKEVE